MRITDYTGKEIQDVWLKATSLAPFASSEEIKEHLETSHDSYECTGSF